MNSSNSTKASPTKPTQRRPPSRGDGAFFYKPQQRLQRNYRNNRRNLANSGSSNNRPTNGSNTSGTNQTNSRPNVSFRRQLLPVKSIALGTNRNSNSNNSGGIGRGSITRTTQNASSAKAASIKFENFLPSNQPKFKIRKKSLLSRRAYVGHFESTIEPRIKKSSLQSKRASDLKGYVDEMHFHKYMKPQVKEFKIRKMKYGTEEEKERILDAKRQYWFEFKEGPKTDTNNSNNSNNNPSNNKIREFLGKPKKDDTNFTYAMIEWDSNMSGETTAFIYPCNYIDFGLKNQLLARGEASSEIYEKQARKLALLRQKHEKEQFSSVFNQLGKLFGHDDSNKKSKDGMDDADKGEIVTTDPKTGKPIILGPNDTNMSDEKRKIYEKLKQNKKDLINGTRLSNKASYLIQNRDSGLKTTDSGGMGNSDVLTNTGIAGGAHQREFDLVHNNKSKRLRMHKTRGALEELPDFEQDFDDDDGDEVGINDDDVVNDDLEDNNIDDIDEFGTMVDMPGNEDDDDNNNNNGNNINKKNQKVDADKDKDINKDNNDDDLDEFDRMDDDDYDSDEFGENFQKLNDLAENTDKIVKKDYEVPLPPKKEDNEENEDENDNNNEKEDDDIDMFDKDDSEDNGNNWMQLTDDEEEEDDDINNSKNKNNNNSSNNNDKNKNGIKNNSRKRPLSGNKGEPNAKRQKLNSNGGQNSGDTLAVYMQVIRDIAPKERGGPDAKEGLSTNAIMTSVSKIIQSAVDKQMFVKAISKTCKKKRKEGKNTFWVLQ